MADEPSPRIFLPSLLAGPLVMLFSLATWWAAHIPQPIEVRLSALPGMLLILPFSAAIGFIPALVLNAIGTMALIKVGNVFPLLRFPFFWALAGGAVSWSIVRQLEFPPEMLFSFTGAGAVSALLCRMRLL